MNRRQLAVGALATSAGLVLFLALGLTDGLRHPQAAVESTRPVEFLAIGSGFFLLTVGVLVLFLASVELPDPDA
ncbi:hypothetical protein [Natronococcus wangiae]|uniref:hypothetical protein n=1 Tax=Natronococcus wangiae TaxID=3068275 RepID=UPI00273E4D18|nr:hypothetical protein [Natronococcus sp. AD5]